MSRKSELGPACRRSKQAFGSVTSSFANSHPILASNMNGGSATRRTSPERRAKTPVAGTLCPAYGPGSYPLGHSLLPGVCTQGETIHAPLPPPRPHNTASVPARDWALLTVRPGVDKEGVGEKGWHS